MYGTTRVVSIGVTGASGKFCAYKQLPWERRGRPSLLAFLTTALISNRADLGLGTLNSLTQPTELPEEGNALRGPAQLFLRIPCIKRAAYDRFQPEIKALQVFTP